MADRVVAYRIVADIGGLLPRMAQASASVKKLGNDVTGVGKDAEKTRRGLDQIGGTAGRFALVAAAGLGVMALKAANFEQAVSRIAAATHESERTCSPCGMLRSVLVRRPSSPPRRPLTRSRNWRRLVLRPPTFLGKNGPCHGALALAAAGELEVAEAAETMATALTQFQLAG